MVPNLVQLFIFLVNKIFKITNFIMQSVKMLQNSKGHDTGNNIVCPLQYWTSNSSLICNL